MEMVKRTSTHNTTPAPGRKIEYIAIHYTAGITSIRGSALNTAWYFAGENAKGSADFIVDDESIVQYNPDIENRYCWAVGGKYNTGGASLIGKATNKNTVSIEICSTNKTHRVPYANDPSWEFTDAAVNKAVELTLYLMELYNIPIDHVVRHYDISGKWCPGIIGWNEDSGDASKWHKFKERLEEGESVKRYNTMSEIPDWAQPAVKKLILAGRLNGKGAPRDSQGYPTDLDLSEDMVRLIVMLG